MRSCAVVVAISALMLWHGPVRAHALLASAEASGLSEADREAAARAESVALDRDETINGFAWQGPDGAAGLLIVSGAFANGFSGPFAMGRCRKLVHIIRHPGDGGVNPTFSAMVCRDWEGKWSVDRRR